MRPPCAESRHQIRSLSTYGSLGITSLNVLLFIITILLIEPWKRRRLVEGVETRCERGLGLAFKRPRADLDTLIRLRTNTVESQEATVAALNTLQALLTGAQDKLDTLATGLTAPAPAVPAPTAVSEAENIDEPTPTSQEADAVAIAEAIVGFDEQLQLQHKKDVFTFSSIGAVGGLILTLIVASLGR